MMKKILAMMLMMLLVVQCFGVAVYADAAEAILTVENNTDIGFVNPVIVVNSDVALDSTVANTGNVEIKYNNDTLNVKEVNISDDGKKITILPNGNLYAATDYSIEFTDVVVKAESNLDFTTRANQQWTENFNWSDYGLSTATWLNIPLLLGKVPYLNSANSDTGSIAYKSELYNNNLADATPGFIYPYNHGNSELVYKLPVGIKSIEILGARWSSAPLADVEALISQDGINFKNANLTFVNKGGSPQRLEWTVTGLDGTATYLQFKFVKKSNGADNSTPAISYIKVNADEDTALVPALQSSTPASGTTEADISNKIMLNFNSPIASIGLVPEMFSVSNMTVESVVATSANTIELILSKLLSSGTEYTVKSEGVKNVYGLSADVDFGFKTAVAADATVEYDLTNASFKNPTYSLNFSQALNPVTVNENAVTLTESTGGKVIPAQVSLSDDNRTIYVTVAGNLCANTGYTITLADTIKTMANSDVAAESKVITFTTAASMTWKEDFQWRQYSSEFADAAWYNRTPAMVEGKIPDLIRISFEGGLGYGDVSDGNGAYASDNGYISCYTASPELVYQLPIGIENIRLTGVKWSETNLVTVKMYVSEDDEHYEQVEVTQTTVYPSANSFEVVYYDVAGLSGKAKYLKLSLASSGRAETPRFNSLEVNAADDIEKIPALVSSVPENNATDVEPGNEITLNFDSALYSAAITPDMFTITGNDEKVKSVAVSEDQKSVTVTLDKATATNKSYTLTSNGLKNVYGKSADVNISFTTLVPAEATISSLDLENALFMTPTYKIISTQPMSAETFDGASVTLKKAGSTEEIQVPIVLDDDGKTMIVSIDKNLLANTQYEIIFPDTIKTEYGMDIANKTLVFATAETAAWEENFDSWSDDSNNWLPCDEALINKAGNGLISVTSESNFIGYIIINGECSISQYKHGRTELVYKIPANIADITITGETYQGNKLTSVYAYVSSDNVNFTEIPLEQTIVPTYNGTQQMVYYKASNVNASGKYFKLALGESGQANQQFDMPRILKIEVNSKAKETEIPELVNSVPVNGASDAELTDEITLKYSALLPTMGIETDMFQVSGRTVTEVVSSDIGDSVTIKLDRILDADTEYVVTTNGLTDVFGNAVVTNVSFKTMPLVTFANSKVLSNGSLISKTGVSSGKYDINAELYAAQNINNCKAVLVAAVYKDNALKALISKNVVSLQKGINTIDFDEQLSVTDENSEIRIFAWENISTLKPVPNKYNNNAEVPLTVYLVGDSICTENYNLANPQQGWGHYFEAFFENGVTVENRALGGRSTKSFIKEGHWDSIKSTLKPGDYVVVAMGHNDRIWNMTEEQRPNGTTEEEFKKYLKQYVDETRALEANIIFVSSIPSVEDTAVVNGKLAVNTLDGTVGDWRRTYTEQSALELGVPFLDLNTSLFNEFKEQPIEVTRQWYMYHDVCLETFFGGDEAALQAACPGTTIANGNDDPTHINKNGAFYVATRVAQLLKESDSALADLLLDNPPSTITED